jgi:RNA polymerase sigma-70 factor (ECF subfamily)
METQGLALAMACPDRSEDLIKLARAGDLAAFEQIILRHERQVLRTALRLLGRMEDAQDAAQEVFLRLYKHLRRFDDAREFAPWLYRVTVNVCRDIHRKRPTTVPLEEMAGPVDAQQDAGLNEQRRIVSEALRTLPEKERAALVLRDIEGLPTSEVARILGSSEVTVRSQVSSARQRIRSFVERRRP